MKSRTKTFSIPTDGGDYAQVIVPSVLTAADKKDLEDWLNFICRIISRYPEEKGDEDYG